MVHTPRARADRWPRTCAQRIAASSPSESRARVLWVYIAFALRADTICATTVDTVSVCIYGLSGCWSVCRLDSLYSSVFFSCLGYEILTRARLDDVCCFVS